MTFTLLKTAASTLAVCALTACTKGQEQQQQAPLPSPVTAVKLEKKTIEDTSEYLATLTSRRSLSLYPQISGYVRSINATPGTSVKAGTLLIQIDAASEQASLQNLEATRESQRSSVSFAKERLARSKLLRSDGIVSQQDDDQARVQADQAESGVRATQALIASQRARLSFFTIVAPINGVVGNVPVKIGDFVTPATLLTSVTQDAGLEAEVAVPVERASSLTAQSAIRLLGGDGKVLAQSAVTFVSPRADPMTQLLLIKGAFDANPSLRADQIVRGRVVWSSKEGLAIPSVSVVRQAGQAFVYVIAPADGGGPLTAQRTPIALGALQGGEYVVAEGLSEGQLVAVSGIQTIEDGSPVKLRATIQEAK